ncbi:4-(cytidine 5'-diphospho)-2-C-methyl-D-erythritol kinase [Methylotuvimicrobium alcaliphilum]|uniref:4-diphosphocytidyl-2-C-methyl-D-erythritol kinase n=1 Tax=Methylotuvimicrobium alcaliphilum (strain DSM 19304 / NCIMB 14124 / VKM B-2133 / 20Z) TaxID=1091494 RepID=G4SU84_META2|nr:4-(cytidine 5'-diphospho)-2-C-methyl-D-erythritol kinase [Methylotuvimicrobium alcaliphilum]CCE25033.1 4-diphosphocytidyl-2-C-methyl-D-erythritol kinase (CMK) (4-(cytidine-5'-diphospho)-2-C-methyl-D-erythritol kinase) [Methylotuvimicrobium alcaliphilum 20Z]
MSEVYKRWPAPAKLNLMLRIVGQREDGYHLLQTVFQFIDLCDWLVFRPVNDSVISLRNPLPGVPEADDLTFRAAQLLKEETGYEGGVVIEIEKHLPMGGGLGGGSSDAATTLVALNNLWRLGLSRERLMQLGLRLGADVPIFVFGHSAWAEGVGEVFQKIEVPEKWIVVLKPDCHVDTKEIFSSKDLTRDSKSIKIADFIAGQHQNDCLGVVRKLYPSVDRALRELSIFSEARLTGTGACVFAQFDTELAAKKAYLPLSKKWQSYLCKGINRSPLYSSLNGA